MNPTLHTYSLLNVTERGTDSVGGHWMQDHIGTLASATKRARAVEAANSHKIDVAVVDKVPCPVAVRSLWTGRVRLDIPRT